MKHAANGMVLMLLAFVLAGGCSTLSRNASAPIGAQKGGYAEGAGASIQQPVNSAAPSTQKATRKRWFATSTRNPAASRQSPDAVVKQDLTNTPGVEVEIPAGPVVPVYEEETTETVLGEHQDAAGILKAAKQLPLIIWAGIAGIIVGLGGYLHAHNNEHTGYPMVWILTGGIGIFLVLLAASGDLSSGWIFAYAVPALLYGAQKFGLLNIPKIP